MSGGKAVRVAVMKRPSACVRVLSDHRGLSSSSEVTSPSRRVLLRVLSGQWRIACSKVSGAEPHRGQASWGSSLHQEGCAAR